MFLYTNTGLYDTIIQQYLKALKEIEIMVKILFVCHGNICRSPLAEFLMKDLIKKQGLENDFYIESAATSNEEIGNGIYPPVKRILNDRGINCANKRARRMTCADYDNFDYIICMDSYNLRNMNYIASDTKGKYSRLLDFTKNSHDVADPWYSRDFATTEREIEQGCNALLKHILNNLK